MTSSPPPPALQATELELAALPTAVSCGRLLIRTHLGRWGLSCLRHDAELIGSELLTNAIEAVGAEAVPDGYAQLHDLRLATVVLGMRLLRHDVLVDVWDGSDDLPAAGMADGLAESGRGLLLVGRLARSWGVTAPARAARSSGP